MFLPERDRCELRRQVVLRSRLDGDFSGKQLVIRPDIG